jgi:hypothetical protein
MRTLADYTLGLIIVLAHLAIVSWNERASRQLNV